MAFNKIKETIAAFKPDPPDLDRTFYISEKSTKLRKLQSSKKKINTTVNLGVYLLVVLPFIYLFNIFWNSLFEIKNTIFTLISSSILTYLYVCFQNEILAKTPFHRLNPYFGNKLEETINAFRKEKKEKQTNMFEEEVI